MMIKKKRKREKNIKWNERRNKLLNWQMENGKRKGEQEKYSLLFWSSGDFFLAVVFVVNIVRTKSDTQADYQEMNLVQQQKNHFR